MKDAFELFKNYKIEKTKIKGKNYRLWVADNSTKRKAGLSGIDKLPKGYGMIFCYDDLVTNSFTMKNTKVPLTVIFLDSNFKIIDYFKCRPFSRKNVNPGKPYKYVVEI